MSIIFDYKRNHGRDVILLAPVPRGIVRLLVLPLVRGLHSLVPRSCVYLCSRCLDDSLSEILCLLPCVEHAGQLRSSLCLRLPPSLLVLLILECLDDGVDLVVEQIVEDPISGTHYHITQFEANLVLVCVVWLVLAEVLFAPREHVS